MSTTSTASPLSGLFSLNLRDVGRSLLMVLIGAVIAGLQQATQAGPIDWPQVKVVMIAALTAGAANLIKQFFTNGATVKEKVVQEEVAAEKSGPTQYNLKRD